MASGRDNGNGSALSMFAAELRAVRPGTFGRMQEHLPATPFPAWFHDWLDAERAATALR